MVTPKEFVIIFNGHLRSRLKMYVEKHTKHQVIKMRKLTMFITRGFITAVCVLYLIICWNIIIYAIWLVYADMKSRVVKQCSLRQGIT